MEVLSFFSDTEYLMEYLEKFLKSYSKLRLNAETKDTFYFDNPKTGRNEIYFHTFYNDVNVEFIRDYSTEEQYEIKTFFGDRKFYFFDIQFREEFFLINLLKDFAIFLEENGLKDIKERILISHPFKGVIRLCDITST